MKKEEKITVKTITFHFYVHLIEYSLFLRTVNMIHMHVETSNTKDILKFPILKKDSEKKSKARK